jgi:outer membrane lipoprotein LolB
MQRRSFKGAARRWVERAVIGITITLIAACATNTRTSDQKDIKNTPEDAQTALQTTELSGRISMVVSSTPVQSFSGGFTLRGSVDTGELALFTPLGGTAGVLRWQSGTAQLESNGKTRLYPTVDAMMQDTTGAALPLEALFAWLHGQNAEAAGWQADVSGFADNGRINAQRSSPAPQVQLRIKVER